MCSKLHSAGLNHCFLVANPGTPSLPTDIFQHTAPAPTPTLALNPKTVAASDSTISYSQVPALKTFVVAGPPYIETVNQPTMLALGSGYNMTSAPAQFPSQSLPMPNSLQLPVLAPQAPGPNMPVQNMPMQSMPMQNMPMQNMPTQSMPMQNMPMQSMPPLEQSSGIPMQGLGGLPASNSQFGQPQPMGTSMPSFGGPNGGMPPAAPIPGIPDPMQPDQMPRNNARGRSSFLRCIFCQC